jgi:hypothetical protein
MVDLKKLKTKQHYFEKKNQQVKGWVLTDSYPS